MTIEITIIQVLKKFLNGICLKIQIKIKKKTKYQKNQLIKIMVVKNLRQKYLLKKIIIYKIMHYFRS